MAKHSAGTLARPDGENALFLAWSPMRIESGLVLRAMQGPQDYYWVTSDAKHRAAPTEDNAERNYWAWLEEYAEELDAIAPF